MKKLSLVAGALLSTVCLSAQVSIVVDVRADVHSISPYVYGANDATAAATAIRWGGNRTSAYNWETNFSNGGADYGPHMSDTHLGSENEGPAAPIITMTQTAKNRGQYALVTLQAMGYVAADANGRVVETEKAPSSRWNEVKFRKLDADEQQLPLSVTPDKADGVVYTDEEINFLINKLGTAGRGGIDGFAIDNEPALWRSTHAFAHPGTVTANELFSKTEAVAAVIKEYAPNAEVYGPMYYSYIDAYLTQAYGVDAYLKNAKELEEKYGKRMIDVLTIHWYPEDRANGNRIVNIEHGNYNLTTPEMVVARLHAPRELWDPTALRNPSAYPKDGAPLLVRLKNSIAANYPGTKLGFTEFKYDAENHFSGGLALVDVLGVFGREGVYMANKWDPIKDNYAIAAYNLYRNYDNKGGAFGATSVRATTTHNDTISTVASLDAQGNLHIMVVNKKDAPQTINYTLQNDLFISGKVFGFDAISSTIKELNAIDAIGNNVFTYTVSAYSATHFVLQAAEQTRLVHAVIPAYDAQKVLLTFDSEIAESDVAGMPNCIITDEDGNPIEFTKFEKTAANQITIDVDYTFSASDSLCTVSYDGINFTGKSGFPIHDFEHVAIKNQLSGAPTLIYDALVNYNGKTIIVNTSKKINDITQLILTKNNIDVDSGFTIEQNGDNMYQYVISVNPRITKFDTIQLSYENSSVQALNKGPYDSPIIESIVTRDNFTLYAYCNATLIDADFNTKDFGIQQGGKELKISSISYYNKCFTITLADTLWSNTEYTLHYTDNDLVKSVMGGYMDDIDGQEIVNNLKLEPEPVTITENTTRIEVEDYTLFRSQSMKIEKTNDVDGNLQFGFVGRNDVFAYSIDVAQAGTYTISLRHSGSAGIVQITAGEQKYDLYMPSSIWDNSALAVELPEGKQMITFTMISATHNLNYFEISKGAHPSGATVTRAQIQRDNKKQLVLTYNRLIETLPLAEELTITINGEPAECTVGYFSESNKTQILLQFADEIKGEWKVSYTETSGRTSNGGILLPYTTVAIDQATAPTIAIFPNPLIVGQRVAIAGDASTTYMCAIRSITGAFVAQQQFTGSTFVDNLPAGLYMITLIAENYNETVKLLVQ